MRAVRAPITTFVPNCGTELGDRSPAYLYHAFLQASCFTKRRFPSPGNCDHASF